MISSSTETNVPDNDYLAVRRVIMRKKRQEKLQEKQRREQLDEEYEV